MPKYKQQVQEMLAANQKIFAQFKVIHDRYLQDPKQWQKEFNYIGRDVTIIIQRWENNLCAKSEGSRFGKFSNALADKFWNEIRMIFPKIDCVGMELAEH